MGTFVCIRALASGLVFACVLRVVMCSWGAFAQMESSASSADLEAVLLELRGLKEFLDKNSQFSPNSLGTPR